MAMTEKYSNVANMDRAELRAIEWDCSQIVIRMGYLLDEGDFEGFASHFTEDGFWMKRGRPLKGRDAIAEDCASRPQNLRIRHVFSNFMVDLIDRDHAHCVCYMSGRRAIIDAEDQGAVPAMDAALWIYRDDMVRTAEGWKIAKRVQERVFENNLPQD